MLPATHAAAVTGAQSIAMPAELQHFRDKVLNDWADNALGSLMAAMSPRSAEVH